MRVRSGAMILLSLLFTVALPAHAARLTLVEKGAPRATILVADKADAVVQLAARELQWHIKKATSAELPITTESKFESEPDRAVVCIGPCVAAKEAGISTDALTPEHYIIRTVGNALFLVGRDGSLNSKAPDPYEMKTTQAGTLFAVADFLDRQLGVRWLWPGELGTYIPKRETFAVRAIDLQAGPRLLQRKFRHPRADALLGGKATYGKRIKISLLPKDRAARERIAREELLWMRRHHMGRRVLLSFGHSFTKWWKWYGKEHPEWFALRPDGERGPIGKRTIYTKFCVSNPAIYPQIIRKWGGKGNIRACPNDGRGYCVCDNCRAMDVPANLPLEEWQKKRALRQLSLSDRYVKFWNAIGAEAKKVDPNYVICGYAYSDYRKPPVATKVTANLILGYVGGSHSVPGAKEAGLYEHWSAWSKAGVRLYYRPNWFWAGFSGPWMPLHEAGQFFNFAYKNRMIGTNFDGFYSDYAARGAYYYVIARLQARPDLSVRAAIKEYCSGFGPAAPHIGRYLKYWEKYTGTAEKLMAGDLEGTSLMHVAFPDEVLDEAERILDKAKAKLRGRYPLEKQRIDFLRLGLQHVRLTTAVTRRTTDPALWSNATEAKAAIKASLALQKFRAEHVADHVLFREGRAEMEVKKYDYTMVGLTQVLGGREPLDVLPSEWAFQWDPEKIGEDEQWFAEDYDPAANQWHKATVIKFWEQQPVGAQWKEQHGEDYDGLAWYRASFDVPAAARDRKINLLFGAVDEAARIWVNGGLAGERPYVKADDWKTPFEIEVTALVRPGEQNTITVRVEDNRGVGGIWKPVWLMGE